MRLKPSFAWKLNQDGFSPMHLALQYGRTKMVLGFLDCESNLVRVQGREDKTHLHYVVEQEDVDLLTEFLSACPQSIQDMTIQNETALYIAVKNHKVDALDFLLGGLRRAYHQGSNTQEGKIINWKDDEGNIVLHVATAMNQPQAVRLLINSNIELNVKNSMGLSALDISNPNSGQVRETLLKAGALNAQSLPQISNNSRDHLRSNLSSKESTVISTTRFRKNISNDTRNVFLVVAALLVTATFQAPLSPPGSAWLDCNNNNNDNNALNITFVNTTSRINTTEIKPNKNEGCSKAHLLGTLMMIGLNEFYVLLNSLAFYSITMVIYFLLPGGQITELLSCPLLCFVLCYIYAWLIHCRKMAIFASVSGGLLYLVFHIWKREGHVIFTGRQIL
ncbi:ankyrin repeat-containing protein BDA1 [Ziziphus jujuba]|uniref:Ankyrin repeat-containing protein BDA1 n=1 Tax=Ziziphus jujuba TaxID=326968 RepID=A0ABM4A1N0_ZIZJJ|nr:ankyrin repeat-containing protein BDA1 [Ziziphus jujuba]